MSWNSARWRLYPLVGMLAMLLAMTWSLSSCAIIPVAAVCSARIECFPAALVASARDFREVRMVGRSEAKQEQRCALRFGFGVAALGHGHQAVGRDRDIAVGRVQDDRSALAHHLRSVGGDELALRVDLHRAVAGVSFAGGGLHDQESLAVDRDVERVAGRLHGACTEV